jgi:ABC-type branched-subunit amino acid transport system ATPase component
MVNEDTHCRAEGCDVLRIAGYVYALRMGEIVFSGKLEDVKQGETMKKLFL